MNTKFLSETRNQRKISAMAGYFDEFISQSIKTVKTMKPRAARVFWVVAGEAVISLSIFLIYLFILFFSRSSYRFVSIFLLVILASNILAKIVLKFIQTYND